MKRAHDIKVAGILEVFSFAGKQPTSLHCLASVLITVLCSLNKRCLAMENTAKGKKKLNKMVINN